MKGLLKRITAAVSAVTLMVTTQFNMVPWADAFAADDASGGKKILLIEDKLPWDSRANTDVLAKIGVDYQKVSTSQFLDVKLEDYAVVIFANDQPFNTYNNYVQFKEYMELYASLGGVIVFGASDAGWAGGSLTGDLPGDVKKIHKYTYVFSLHLREDHL